MRKIFQIIYVIALVVSFHSCKDTGTNNPTEGAEKSGQTTEKLVHTNKKPASEKKGELSLELQESMASGVTIYGQNCAVCHQKDGGGVPNMNPPLKGADYVMGDKKPLITLLLQGSSDKRIEVNGKTYSNVMPSFAALDDAQITHVLNYIRNSFGNKASTVSPEEVRDVRSSVQ